MSYLLMPAHQPGPGTELVQHIDWAPGMGCACESKGMGLFDSGFDISGWGWLEWGLAGLGGYMVLSTVFTTQRAVGRVREGVKRTRKRVARKIQGNPSGLKKAWGRYTKEGLSPRVKDKMLRSESRAKKRTASGKRDIYRQGR